MGAWSVYVVRCADGSLYTGISTDITRRFAEHCAQGKRCAKYLRGRAPLKLEFSQIVGDKSRALAVELWIKKLPRVSKEALLAGELTWP